MIENQKIKELFDSLKGYSHDKEIYISKIIDNTIFYLINRRFDTNEDLDSNKINDFSNYIKEILNDLYLDYIDRSGSNNEITSDVEYIASGFTSITVRVGDNIIKIGKDEYGIIPNEIDSIYQVPTYIRESVEIGKKNYLRVEVAPYVDTNNITYEDTYKAYCNIRNLGYIWNDPKEENLGRIINVSGCKIKGKKYLPSHSYKKGDLVLIDLDDIAYVGEETSDIIMEEISMMSYNRNVYIFETKYMKEKNLRNTNSKSK